MSALTPEAARVCLEYPTELAVDAEPSSLFMGDAGAFRPFSRTDLTSVALPGRHVLAPSQHFFVILVYRGRSTFKEYLEQLPTREGAPPLTSDMVTTPFEVTPGRRAQLSVLSIMMGGALIWATLPSPHKTYDLTLYFARPRHDSVHDKAGEAPFEAVTRLAQPEESLPRALRCLDHLLWP